MRKVFLYHYKINPALKLEPAEWLSESEMSRFLRMSDLKRKQEFLHSRFLLQSILRALHGRRRVVLQLKKDGKPYVRGLKFNLSHSGNTVVLAVHRTLELGVDVEASKDKKFYREITEQYFSKTEAQYIFAGKGRAHQMKRFRSIWSLKEAFIKAGDGVLNKRLLQISFDPARKRVEKSPVRNISFFYSEKLNTGVCVRGRIQRKDFIVWDVKASGRRDFIITLGARGGRQSGFVQLQMA